MFSWLKNSDVAVTDLIGWQSPWQRRSSSRCRLLWKRRKRSQEARCKCTHTCTCHWNHCSLSRWVQVLLHIYVGLFLGLGAPALLCGLVSWFRCSCIVMWACFFEILFCFSTSLSIVGNLGFTYLGKVRHSSRKSSATHSYQCV